MRILYHGLIGCVLVPRGLGCHIQLNLRRRGEVVTEMVGVFMAKCECELIVSLALDLSMKLGRQFPAGIYVEIKALTP